MQLELLIVSSDVHRTFWADTFLTTEETASEKGMASKYSYCKDRNIIQEKLYHFNIPAVDLQGSLKACKMLFDYIFWFSQQIDIFQWGAISCYCYRD